MRKLVLGLILAGAVVGCSKEVQAAEMTITIPDAKVTRVLNAFEVVYPIPKDSEGTPLYTQAQWARLVIKRFIINTVTRGENKVAREAATVPEDNTIADVS